MCLQNECLADDIKIRIVQAGSIEYKQSLVIRHTILRKPLGLSLFEEDLRKEVDDLHICAFLKEHLIGVLILTPLTQNTIKMRQVAVDEGYQRQGIGSKIVVFAEKEAQKLGFSTIVLHARKTAIPFYKKLNYKVIGEEFMEVNIPHYEMEKDLRIL